MPLTATISLSGKIFCRTPKGHRIMTNASTMFSDYTKSIKIDGPKTCQDEICCLDSCNIFQYNSHLCHSHFNTALFSVRFATFALIFMEKALNCQSIINTMNKLITSSMLKKEKQLTSICAQFFFYTRGRHFHIIH